MFIACLVFCLTFLALSSLLHVVHLYITCRNRSAMASFINLSENRGFLCGYKKLTVPNLPLSIPDNVNFSIPTVSYKYARAVWTVMN